jgi:peptide/nickel transport system substrate-binding protein
MRQKSIQLTSVAIGVTAALALAACSSTTSGNNGPTATASTGGTLYVLAENPYSYLDPASGFDAGVDDFYRLIYRTLTNYVAAPGAAGESVVGDLATNTGVPSDDFKTWTFTLRKDLYFQNGQPITSQDLKFGVERSWDPTVGIGDPTAKETILAPASYKGPYLSGSLSSIQTPTPSTIVFHLTASTPTFGVDDATSTDFTPFPIGTGKAGAFNTSPISSGPYEVSSFKKGVSMTLVRNPYWQRSSDPIRPAKPSKIIFEFGLSDNTIDQRLIADEHTDTDAIDFDSIQPADVVKLSSLSGRYAQGIENCVYFTVLNTAKAPLNNLQVRQAIAWATDKQTVVDAAGGTLLATPATSIEPPSMLGRVNTSAFPTATGNVAQAKALLKAAGYASGFTMTLQTAGTYQNWAVAIQAALARVGITARIQTIPASTYWQTIETPSQEAQSAIGGWCSSYTNAYDYLDSMFQGTLISTTGNDDWSMLNNKSLNADLTNLDALTDMGTLDAQSGQLDLTIQRLVPVVPLLYLSWVTLYGSNVTGVYAAAAYAAEPDLVAVGLKNPDQ